VLYCRDCSEAACEMCFIQLHNGHRYASIEDVVDQLRAQLDSLLNTVQSRTSAVSQQLDTLQQYRTQLTANVNVRPFATRGVDPYWTGETCPPIFMKGGTSMVMSPNILEVMSFRMSIRVAATVVVVF